MDGYKIRGLVDSIASSSKKDRKNNAVKLLNALQVAANRDIINSCSHKRHHNPTLHAVSWDFILESILRVIMFEVNSSGSFTNRNKSSVTPELTPYIRILRNIALYGSKESQPLTLDELVLCFLQIVRDKGIACLHQSFVDVLCVFLSEAPIGMVTLNARHRDDLIFWCCAQLDSSLLLVSRLLCLIIHQCYEKPSLPLLHISTTLVKFIRRCNSVTNESKLMYIANLGWVCFMLRWMISNVYANVSDWREIAAVIDQTVPSFLGLLFDQQMSHMFTANIDVLNKSKGTGVSQRYPAHDNSLEFLTEPWANESSWEMVSLTSSFIANINSVQSKKLSVQYHPEAVQMTYTYRFFFPEHLPKLGVDSKSFVHENGGLNTQQELFYVWSWAFSFHHYRHLLRKPTAVGGSCQGSTVLLKYLLQELNSLTSRLSFQNEDTCWKTITSCKDFFSLLAAVLMVECYKNSTDYNNEYKDFSDFLRKQMICDTEEHQNERKKARIEINSSDFEPSMPSVVLWDTLVDLASNDTKFGCLWWLIIDWIIRLMWQTAVVLRSEGEKYDLLTDIETLLEKISTSVKVKRMPLANECLVTMLHTLVVVLNYEIHQGFSSQAPSSGSISAFNGLWEFAISLFEQCSTQRNRMQSFRREGLLSGHRFLNRDRLVCNLLSNLMYFQNSVKNKYFKCTNLPNICLRIFSSLVNCVDLDASHLNNSPWRVRLIVLCSANSKLPKHIIPCDAFDQPTIPDVLLFYPAIIFLLNNYAKIWNTDDNMITDEMTRSEVPEMNNLLGGILWGYKSLLNQYTPSIHSFNPWSYTQCDWKQPLYGNEDHIKAIDYIRKFISVHSCFNANLPVTNDNLPSFVSLLTIELSLIQFKCKLLKSACKYLNELSPLYSVITRQVLKQISDYLLSTFEKQSLVEEFNDFSVQLSTGDFHKNCIKTDNFVKSLEILLEVLAFGEDGLSFIVPTHIDQLIEFSTSLSIKYTGERSFTESTFRLMASSGHLEQTAFGDEDFCDNDQTAIIETSSESQDNFQEILMRKKFYFSVKVRIFSALFLFGLRTENICLLERMHESLQKSLEKSVLELKKFTKWLCKLSEHISQCLCKTFSPKKYGCKLSSGLSEVISYFITSLVSPICEVLKSLLALPSHLISISPIIKLVRCLCLFSDCTVLMYQIQKETSSNLDETEQWKLIGQHINKILQAAWSAGARFFEKSLLGFQSATVVCLKSWIKLYSAQIIDTSVSVEYYLAPTLQDITPTSVFQLANFLQSLITKSYDVYWAQTNQSAVLHICQRLLKSLSSNALKFISLKGETDALHMNNNNLNFTVYLYSLILKLLTVLSSSTVSEDSKSSALSLSDEIQPVLHPNLECLSTCCVQMSVVYSKDDAEGCYQIFKLFTEILAEDKEDYFREHIRPALLLLVLGRWLRNFNLEGFELCEHLAIFPWKCWGISDFQNAQEEISQVLATLTITNFYKPTVGLQNLTAIAPHLKSHTPELVGAILIHSVTRDMNENNKFMPYGIIYELFRDPKLSRVTLMETRNLCKIIQSVLEFLILYNISDKNCADNSSQSLPYYQYAWFILVKALSKLYTNLNNEQLDPSLASPSQTSNTTEYHLKYVYNLLNENRIDSDLVNRLYQVGVQLLCSKSTSVKSYHLKPYHKRLSCWCAISKLIIDLLFDEALPNNHRIQLSQTQQFAFWLVVTGHLSLLSSETTRVEHFSELFDSLHYVLVKIRPFLTDKYNLKLLTGIHHSTVYTLNTIVKCLLQKNESFLSLHQSTYNDELMKLLLNKISTILKLIVSNDTPVFLNANCQLFPFPDHFVSSEICPITFFAKYQNYITSVSPSDENSFHQILRITSNDMKLYRICHFPQLLLYPIETFKDILINTLDILSFNKHYKSAVKLDLLIGEIKSVLMKKSTESGYTYIGLTSFDTHQGADSGYVVGTDLLNTNDLIANLKELLNSSTCEMCFEEHLSLSNCNARKSALHCFNFFNQVSNFQHQSTFNLLDPASRSLYSENAQNDSNFDPMFCIKRQILFAIMQKAYTPNLLSSLSASDVLHNLFSRCSTLITSLLKNSNGNDLPAYFATILDPYMKTNVFDCASTGNLKAKEKILENLPMLMSKLRVYLENSLTIGEETTFQSWLIKFVLLFLESGLIQDEFILCIKSFLPFSVRLTEKLCPWLIANYLIGVGSSEKMDTTLHQFNSILCEGIWKCLSQEIGDPCSKLHSFQNIWLECLLSLNHFIQWIRRSGKNVILSPSININWLTCADRATTLKRPYEARLFLELAWLSDESPNDWITNNQFNHRVWVNLCRLSGDLSGLMASQTTFLTVNNPEIVINDKISHFDIHPILEETKLAVHELLGDWTYLLSCYDKHDLNRELTSSSSNIHPKLAVCLQRLGANRLFEKFCHDETINLSGDKQSYIALQELRSSALWRLGRWDTEVNSLNHSHWICPPTNWKDCGLEATFYWLLKAASQADWNRISEIVTAQSDLLIEDLYSDSIRFLSSEQLMLCGQKISFLNTINQIGYTLGHTNNNNNDNLHIALILSLLCQSLNSINFSSAHNSQLQVNSQTMLDSIEPFLTLSTGFLGVLLSKNIIPDNFKAELSNLLVHTYLHYAEIASSNASSLHLVKNWLEDAVNCQKFVRNIDNNTSYLKQLSGLNYTWQNLRCIKLKSYLERQQGDFDLSVNRLQSGLQTVKEILEETDKSSEFLTGVMNCYIHGTTLLCDWLYDSRTRSAADLLTNYIEPAMNLAQRRNLNPDANAYMNLAKFSDAQFTALDSYLTSPEFETRKKFLIHAEKDVVVLSDLGEKSRLLRLLQRQSALEVDELSSLKEDADHFLEAAVSAYAQCLALSDDHNLLIFRFVSLWLSSNSSTYMDRSLKINKIMSEQLSAISADKFLPLVPQLAARLSTNCEGEMGFQNILMKLIERIVNRHPHHSAFTLLFLVNAKLDDAPNEISQTPGQRCKNRSNSSKIPNNDLGSSTELTCRIQAAKQLYQRLCLGEHSTLLSQMQYLAEAYVEFANTDVDKHKTNSGDIPLPSDCKLYRLIAPVWRSSSRNNTECPVIHVAVPTCTIPIDRSGSYQHARLIRVEGFSPHFRLVGGINLPKVINCLGTDGKLYRQLVKGKDDPRQDAVMQQVFTAANCLLTKYGKYNRTNILKYSTSQVNQCKYRANWSDTDNGLRIRTYKVIPMAQRSGVIEWLEGTVTLGDWLANERSGAHQRYRPRDMPPIDAKRRLAAVKDSTPNRKLREFNQICEKLKPVLAYFFLEQFPSPQDWFKSRMAYIRSLAVTSMVGYLVGLGDRHPHNLLLHKSSGELVHIDLGVAFDQGRLLPTPEMVPFRLSRDLVHALGPLGLQAGFIPAAEAVLRELREGSDVILTLLQVLLYDPLYSWSLTPAQIYAIESKRAAETDRSLDKSKSILLSEEQCTNKTKSIKKVNSKINTRSTENNSIIPSNPCQPTTDAVTIIGEPVNQLAERVLLGVRSKLQGLVNGNLVTNSNETSGNCGGGGGGDSGTRGGLDQLDVAGHVGLLVRAATDYSNLSRMYFGWQAYL